MKIFRKKILVMPDGNWLSHVSRTYEIARVLRQKGHAVLFAGEGQYMQLPRDAGFEVRALRTLPPERVLACSRSGRANWYDHALLKDLVDAEVGLFQEVRPDLVLGDFRLSLSTSCEISGVPLAVILNAAWTNYSAVRLRAPEHFPVTRVLGRRLTTLLVPLLKYGVLSVDSFPYRRLRRERGLSPRANIWDVWRGDLNLIVDVPEFWPTKDLPPEFHYIGPLVWEPEGEMPPWFEHLDSDRPTIYCTMGSTGYPRFFHHALEVFANSRYQCIMTTAGMVRLPKLPDNVFAVDYAPGGKIMERSDAVVCHGGNGTIYQALSFGVPIIGIPTMHDQEFNLDRVSDLGLGIHLSERKFKPEHLADAVGTVLAEPSYRKKARTFSTVMKSYAGPRRGAEIIHAFLEHH